MEPYTNLSEIKKELYNVEIKKETGKESGFQKHQKTLEKPYKQQEFNTYLTWKSLPSVLKGKTREELTDLGYNDELLVELLQIKNQAEFAKKFDLQPVTLSEWNKRIQENDLLTNGIKDWSKKLTKNVISALYERTLKTGNASDTKLWLQYIEGWTEKQEIKRGISDELKQTIDKLNSIIES
ncbi:MAG: hypothetical protein Q8R26_00275 [bacterium]|nr:hypothetical protein [bacterium]